MQYLEYEDGLNMNQFKHVKDISSYNSNYYVGLKPGDILYADSDDDHTTEWYLIRNMEFIYLGESYSYGPETEPLHRHDHPLT